MYCCHGRLLAAYQMKTVAFFAPIQFLLDTGIKPLYNLFLRFPSLISACSVPWRFNVSTVDESEILKLLVRYHYTSRIKISSPDLSKVSVVKQNRSQNKYLQPNPHHRNCPYNHSDKRSAGIHGQCASCIHFIVGGDKIHAWAIIHNLMCILILTKYLHQLLPIQWV